MATDRLERLLAGLEAQGIHAMRVLEIAKHHAEECSAMHGNVTDGRRGCCWHADAALDLGYLIVALSDLRALADAATEPERAELCPRCESDTPDFKFTGCHGTPHPWHDGGSR